MPVWLVVVLCIVGGVVAIVLLVRAIGRAVLSGLDAEVSRRFPADRIRWREPGANFFGFRSRGLGQVRGTGALLLLDDRLWFLQGVTQREIDIPLDRITGVTLPRSFLSRTIFRPLLCVAFVGPDGVSDEVAFAVRDAADWKERLEAVRGGGNPASGV